MQVVVEEVKLPQEIKFNYEELKRELSDKVKMYETLVYTEDQIKSAKADRADLNRLKKALNDERIRREKEYMQPFNAFKAQINEIIGIIDKPVALIDKQIKEYEEEQKQKKADAIAQYWDSVESPEWLDLDKVYNSKWLNASVSMKSIQSEIDSRIESINSDLTKLSDLPEFAFEAIETYKSTLDISKSIAEGHRLSEIQKRKAEQERIKAEQEKERAEQERLRKEQEEQLPFDFDRSNDNVENPTLAVQSPKELPTYVCFKALLTVSQALELKEFFESRNIEFSRI